MTRSEALQTIRARKPLLHCISNLVTANDCANLALAVGASPIMAQAPQEMDDIAALASAVVLNTVPPTMPSSPLPGWPVPPPIAAVSRSF